MMNIDLRRDNEIEGGEVDMEFITVASSILRESDILDHSGFYLLKS